MRIRLHLVALPVLLGLCPLAEGKELATIERPRSDRLVSRVFTLDRDQQVRISGVTLARDDWDTARIWVLDARTRKVVWDVADADVKHRLSGLGRFDDEVRLAGGEYEVHFAVFPDWSSDDVEDIIGRIFNGLFRGRHYRDDDSRLEQLEVHVAGEGTNGGEIAQGKVPNRFGEQAVVALVGVGDSAEVSAGFTLSAPAEVRVRCIGEAERKETYDGGWIVDADSGTTVWRFDYFDSEPAGGADKNRIVDTVLKLPAGRYVAHYETDNEHSYPEFNAPPPDDPLAWGVTVAAEKPADAKLLARVDAAPLQERNVIVALTKLGDDEHRSAGFTLRRAGEVRIIALGEGTKNEMADYGWIESARTHEPVWEMEYNETDHAGGAAKNRIVERVLRLEAGSYVVHFVTDGSHSYEDWNTAPPFDRSRWGITVLATDPKLAAADVTSYEASRDDRALVRIDRVEDNERRVETLTLERDTDVEIYALGEADGDEMVDYAYIEDTRGKTAWEMYYRDTEPAGGASKNRVFRGRVHLVAGTYKVTYESDGSHSYGDWNAAPPRDPDAWGITITPAEKLPAEAPPR
jgi:hypothetical protein